MAPPLFYDLSLLPSSSSAATATATAAARALDLGYAAVALDHPHRGLLADSDRCRHGPSRHYTRVTLSLDSAAAAASALAPSAARLLRTYDIVAARPLTQAAFDHLCQLQPTADLDLISIDFSHKLPFRLKLPMLRLALQRGLYFEIAYSPLISDVSSRRQVLAEAKLLVDWTKGKNIIISSAAHTANEIRGPYDVINLCAYLLGLSTQRAKAAISLNCRSLISRALRKKHFYKETIRVDRLLPNEQLDPAKFKLGDWIGWDPVSCKGDVHFLETNLEPSTNKDDLLSSSMNNTIKVLHEEPHNADVSLFTEQPEQPTYEREIPSQMEEGAVEVIRGDVLMNCELSTLPPSSSHQNADEDIVLDNPEKNEAAMAHYEHAGAASSLDLKSVDGKVEFVQDAMEIDATESCKLNLIAGGSNNSIELPDTNLEDKGPESPVQSNDIKYYANTHTKHGTGCTSSDREDQAPLDHEIPSCSDVCIEDKGPIHSSDISVHTEGHTDTAEALECMIIGKDDKVQLDPAVHLSSDSCTDIILPQRVMEEKTEYNMDEDIQQNTRDQVESIDRKTSTTISMEHTPHGQAEGSALFVYDESSINTALENNEFKIQKSNKTCASLEEDDAKIHGQLLNYSYASDKVESATRSEKRRQKLRLHRLSYLPFLGFLKSVPFKKKVSKLR